MNCKVEKTKNANEVKLEITVEAEKFDEAIKKVYFKSAKYFNIPGFRKGKAPMQINLVLLVLTSVKDLHVHGNQT